MSAEKLTWEPPEGWESYTNVNASNANRNITLNANTDYKITITEPITATGGLVITGGRNVVMMGGEINVPQQWSEADPLFPHLFPQQTITVTGETFQITNGPTGHNYNVSSVLPKESTAAEVKAALEAMPELHTVAGEHEKGGVFAVEGPTGGPFKITFNTPNFHARRLTATGATVHYESDTWTDARGLYIASFTGTFHVEGLYIHGAGCEEAMDIGASKGRVQLQNCILSPEAHCFNLEHFHGDALQAWSGPIRLRMDRVFMRNVRYQGFTAEPTVQAGGLLTELENWYLKRVYIHAENNPNLVPPAGEGLGYPFYWAKPGGSFPEWRLIGGPVVVSANPSERPENELYYSNGYNGNVPDGNLNIKFNEPEPSWNVQASEVGVGYVSPGYEPNEERSGEGLANSVGFIATLAEECSSTALELKVNGSVPEALRGQQFRICVGSEIMLVTETAIQGESPWRVVRDVEPVAGGTGAVEHKKSSKIELVLTAGSILTAIEEAPITEAKLTVEDEGKLVPAGGTAGYVLTRKGTDETEWHVPSETGLTPGAVITEYLAEEAVTAAKIGANAIVGAKLSNGAVAESKIAGEAVTAAKIHNTTITLAKLNAEVTAQMMVGTKHAAITAPTETLASLKTTVETLITVLKERGITS